MGIKGWIGIGGAALLGIAALFGWKKKEDKRKEEVNGRIIYVDFNQNEKEKNEEKEEKTVDELQNDVDQAMEVMDMMTDNDGNWDEKAYSFEEIEKAYQKEKKWKQEILDDIAPEKWVKEAQEDEKFDEQNTNTEEKLTLEQQIEKYRAKKDATWPAEVKNAIERKDFRKLESLFDYKYAGGPWHPSPASVFGDARQNGEITDELYSEAAKYFGKLWNYSGD